MSQRARTSPAASGLAESELEAERILEGRAEIISGALRPHAEMEAVLAARGWKRRFLTRADQVSSLVAESGRVREALERVRHRAAVEAWAEDLPVLRQARALSEQRERLTRLARQRLDTLTVAPADVTLEEALTRLDALLRQPVRKALAPGEVVVFEPVSRRERSFQSGPGVAGSNVPTHFALLVPLGALLFVLLAFFAPPEYRPLGPLFAVLGIGAALLWPLLRSGRLRITSERLHWSPFIGEAQAVRLDTIADDGIRLDRGQFDLEVKGDRRLLARSVTDVSGLMLMLELHRQPPLLGAARSGVQLEDAALFPAKLGRRRGSAYCVPSRWRSSSTGVAPRRCRP